MQSGRSRQPAGIYFDRRLRRLLTPYIDGELDRKTHERVAGHLKQCSACRAERDRLLFASQIVSRLALDDAPPAGVPQWVVPVSKAVASPHERPSRKILAPVAAAIILIAAVVLLWRVAFNTREPEIAVATNAGWEVVRLSGTPSINSNQMHKTAQIKTGDWLETDDKSRALLNLGVLGQVEVDQNTRISLVESASNEQRLKMTRGRIYATIAAPPRIVFIETPSGLAIDLGCAYSLEVDDAGRSALYVNSGAVALAHKGRESVVPAFATCRARPDAGPGTPHFHTASERLRDALEEFDFESGGSRALEVILSEARADDAVTLWNLLKRVEGADRERVFDRLAKLVPTPEDVTKDGALALDQLMLNSWLQKIEQARVNPFAKHKLAPGSIKITGNMETERSWHRATLLPDGKVLVTGGMDSYARALASAEIYDPATGEFSAAAQMNSKRAVHTATILTNNQVLITGGTASGDDSKNLSSAEIYDPRTGRFTPTGNMRVARAGHEATLLADGRVLITGGMGVNAETPWLRSAEIYDPQTGSFTPAGDMREPRVDHTATLLGNGKVLIAGGYGNRGSRSGVTQSAEIYDAATGAFSPAPDMNFHRFKHSAVLLADGRVLIAGGIADAPASPRRSTTAELYDPQANSFVKTGDMVLHRYKVKNAAQRLRDGRVLIVGGSWGFEVYDPVTGAFSMKTDRITPTRYYSTATLLAGGDVIIIGGYSGIQPEDYFHSSAGAWIYKSE